jgi:hypothetical protein
MTYGEAKEIIRDYGFEGDSIYSEYQTVIKNALNTAIQNIYDDMVIQLKGYYKKTLSTEEEEWAPVRPEIITDNTDDDFVIALPDNLLVLVPLLAGHFVWFDDDTQKAVNYYNDYEDFRQKILIACTADVRGTIEGGLRW